MKMDDTTQSRTSDAAATRKRRSSILKSQRPPRTPFCELEFNVCTPTDTTKSRRVSFSRRTGVAEFVTNEATTTWKNFYEEHNKSLESSGNDSADVNNHKQPIGHIGKRIFDQQFEEVEAVDFLGSLNPGISSCTSINNINFTQELECTNSKLLAPQNNFAFSNVTEQQSKLFEDDLSISCAGQVSGGININFSDIQQIGQADDLDEIQKDLDRQSNIICHEPFNGRQNMSEYIEVDLNMTHVAMTNEESDMSITDTVHSPKVQEISKSCSIDKKMNVEKDWVTDKENIIINPYITPRESVNFAINEEPDKVLVFDGKKLIVQTEPKKENYRQTLLPGASEVVPQRKTIVLNCNDDLPNFIDDMQIPKKDSTSSISELKQSVIFDADMSITQAKLNATQNIQRTILYDDDLADISVTQGVAIVAAPLIPPEIEKRHTIYENALGNISITQAQPSKIIDMGKDEKRRTVIFENDNRNISITQPLSNVIFSESKDIRKTIVIANEACNIFVTPVMPTNIIIPDNIATKRRTIVFGNDNGNVSITQAIPNVIIEDNNENRRTITYDNDIGNILSSTQPQTTNENCIKNVTLPEPRRTVVFENDVGNLSVTQALPTNIILPQKINVTKYDDSDDDDNISMTQALPAKIILQTEDKESNRQTTVVYDDDMENLSITQAVPTNHIIQELVNQKKIVDSSANETTYEVSLANSEVVTNKSKTMIFDNDNIDLSMTLAVKTNKLLPGLVQEENLLSNSSAVTDIDKRRTIVFENDAADISVTQAVPMNRVIETINERLKEINEIKETTKVDLPLTSNKRKTIVFENEGANLSMTQTVDVNQLLQKTMECCTTENIDRTNVTSHDVTNKRRTVVFENDDADISMTQAVNAHEVTDKRRTVPFKNDDADISMTQAVNALDVTNIRRTVLLENDDPDISMTQAVDDVTNKRRTIVLKNDNADFSMTKAVNAHDVTNKRRTVVLENDDADISMTQTVNAHNVSNKRRTVLFENDDADISITQAVNAHDVTNKRRTDVFENDNADISITQAVNVNEVFEGTIKKINSIEENKQGLPNTSIKIEAKVLKDENADLSITKSVNVNRLIQTDIEQTDHIEATKAALHNVTNKINSILFENKDTDVAITQTVDVNIVLQKNIEGKKYEATTASHTTNTRRKTVVFANVDTSLSTTQEVDKNEVLHANTEPIDTNVKADKVALDNTTEKRGTHVFDNKDISVTETADMKKVLQFLHEKSNELHNLSQKETEAATNTVLQFHNELENKRGTLMFDDDEENTLKKSRNPIKIKFDKKRTIVVEDIDTMLENKDLFMEIDKLNDEKQTINKIEHDVSMTEVDAESTSKETIICKVDDMSISEGISPDIPGGANNDRRSVLFDEITNSTLSKPIPASFAFNSKLYDKPQKEMSENIDMLLNVSNAVSNVIIYQAGTVNTNNIKHARVQEDNSNTQEPVATENVQEIKPSTVNTSEMVTTAYLAKLSSFCKKRKVKQKHESDRESGETLETSHKSANINESAEESKLLETSKTHVENIARVMPKDSILNVLLDMSHSSLNTEEFDKSLKVKEGFIDSLNEEECIRSTESFVTYTVPGNDSRQHIAINKDRDADRANRFQENINTKLNTTGRISETCNRSVIHIEYQEDLKSKIEENLHVEYTTLKSALKESNNPHYNKKEEFNIERSESRKSLEKPMTAKKEISPKYGKCFKMANDTNELLEMLSDFTDQRKSTNLDPHLEEDECNSQLHVVNSPLTLYNTEETVPDLLKRFACPSHETISEPQSKIHMSISEDETSQPVHLKRHNFVSNEDTSEAAESKKSSQKDLLESTHQKKLTFVPIEETSEPEESIRSFVTKAETSEPVQQGRLSLVSMRQSIVLSREDLLNNLSMAGAALQKSRFDLDESENVNDTTKETPDNDVSHKKSVRVSNDVVKTLHFEDDESISEASVKTEINTTLLKKTAFGETTFMKDVKNKVIPNYAETIDDGIKELMNDLTKPMADVLPFSAVTLDRVKKSPSVRSNQIQANLQTSSQVDLGTELYSNESESMLDMSKYSSAEVIASAVKNSPRLFRSSGKPNITFSQSEKSIEVDYVSQNTGMKSAIPFTPSKQERPRSPGAVLIFDHSNPLNNVFLPPPYMVEAHSYNPAPSRDTIDGNSVLENASETNLSILLLDKESERDNSKFSTHYRVESRFINQNPLMYIGENERGDIHEKKSNMSKTMSIDQSTDPLSSQDLKHTEVNTEIVMKGNKELLAASSSLTLVDDALVRNVFDLDIETNISPPSKKCAHVQVLYKSVDSPEKLRTKSSANDDLRDKPKKRFHSPATMKNSHKHCTLSSLDVTPKPLSKMQKLSTSPLIEDLPKLPDVFHEKCGKRSQAKKPNSIMAVQQVMVHQEKCHPAYVISKNKASPLSATRLNYEKSEATVIPASSETRSVVSNVEDGKSDITSSFTSSKNLRDESDTNSLEDSRTASQQSSRMDWIPHGSLSRVSSKFVDSDCALNIFDMVDLLPFMGSHECEWEFSNESSWSFRLLHSRLRLTIRFQRNKGIRADTPVTDVAIETIHHDKKNPLGALCVKFSAQVMRYYIARGCSVAGEVPKLIRQAAASARLAARWARAMHDARLRLAYTLTNEGWLSLKVANVSLRCVWEVTMQLEMVAEDARSMPWVRAGDVRVSRVLGGPAAPAPAALRRALAHVPKDWGHAPRVIWKLFRVLKNKKRDDDMMLPK